MQCSSKNNTPPGDIIIAAMRMAYLRFRPPPPPRPPPVPPCDSFADDRPGISREAVIWHNISANSETNAILVNAMDRICIIKNGNNDINVFREIAYCDPIAAIFAPNPPDIVEVDPMAIILEKNSSYT